MPGGYDVVCSSSNFGVPTADPSGCAQHLTLEGMFQQQIDAYSYVLLNAREAVLYGNDPGFGHSVQTPDMIAADMQAQAEAFCKVNPSVCPSIPSDLAASYSAMLYDQAAQFGFTGTGSYNAALDNQPPDALFPEGITPTPMQGGPNIVSYSPSTGYRPPIDSLPVTLSPTIPAFTSPENVKATSPGSPSASGGGTTLAGTASGSGPSSGGSQTQQTRLDPNSGQASVVSSMTLAGDQKKLLIILLVIAVAVIMFGRGN